MKNIIDLLQQGNRRTILYYTIILLYCISTVLVPVTGPQPERNVHGDYMTEYYVFVNFILYLNMKTNLCRNARVIPMYITVYY
jgi:hypothetical protein